jgi:hypothetical protein
MIYWKKRNIVVGNAQFSFVNLLNSGPDRFFFGKMRDTNLFKKILLCPDFLSILIENLETPSFL